MPIGARSEATALTISNGIATAYFRPVTTGQLSAGAEARARLTERSEKSEEKMRMAFPSFPFSGVPIQVRESSSGKPLCLVFLSQRRQLAVRKVRYPGCFEDERIEEGEKDEGQRRRSLLRWPQGDVLEGERRFRSCNGEVDQTGIYLWAGCIRSRLARSHKRQVDPGN